MREKITTKYIDREISWLAFNGRVLQEAADEKVPLLTRLKFLGIFSNNLDEFFRVRVATLKRIVAFNNKAKIALGFSPKKILKQIHNIVLEQQEKFETIYANILTELAKNHVFIVNEGQLTIEQGKKVKTYFHNKVRSLLVPIMIGDIQKIPPLKDGSIYLALHLSKQYTNDPPKFALIEIPTAKISRFFVLENSIAHSYVILLDDVIRYCLTDIFSIFGYDDCKAYTIKITKDAEMDIDNDVSKSFLELLSKAVKNRKHGRPVRFIYDQEIPDDLLNFLHSRLNVKKGDNIIPAGRYHNFKDFMSFPNLGPKHLQDISKPPLPHVDIDPKKSLFKLVKQKDIMLSYPYQSFHPIIDFLREAAIDPTVKYIKMTLYRLAPHSNIINALISARKNGKEVTAVIELQARFDEKANIEWAKILQEADIKVVHGKPGLKIHSKLCLVKRIENKEPVYYAHIGTGNFHEKTAKVYADHSLLTAHKEITKEVRKVFDLIEKEKSYTFKHLLVSPHYMFNKLASFIDREIEHAKNGKKAYIIAKMNSLNDEGVIEKLHEASRHGVQVDLIIRGICCLVPNVAGVSENIRAISIVDQYLEHARLYVFANGGEEAYYISSADWLERNLHRRIEVACPVYDKEIQQELKQMLLFQLQDNTKARLLGANVDNIYKTNEEAPFKAQEATYQYFKHKLATIENKQTSLLLDN